MRLKIASVLLLAGTVVGCANNPPPPPPPAPEPAPAPPPPPAAMAPTTGVYRGMADLPGGPAAGCRAPRGTQTARVRGQTITLAGIRGTIGPDGTVTGRNLTGTVNGGTADLTVTRGKCATHYSLTNGSSSSSSSSSSMQGGSSSMQGGSSSMSAPAPAQ